MFNIFKKKKITFPDFNELRESKIKNKYFMRSATWDVLNNQMISVTDNYRPRMITMDPWPQTIFLEATGHRTISDFVYDMAKQYSNKNIPAELDSTILMGIESLLELRIIELYDSPKVLPYYLDQPTSKQDLDRARKLMIADGFIEE